MFRVTKNVKTPARLDLVPLINIVFLLLIFFMLTTTAMSQKNKIELPKAESATLKNKTPIVIGIIPGDQIELDRTIVAIESLGPLLKDKIQAQDNKLIEIQADKSVNFSIFSQVVEAAQEAGAADFILAAEQAPQDSQPSS
ncbi:MAG: biopolymer transporter ExbD [Candidatus Nitrohelix vancouverensis]|uniref:Biopolymer transporter ExbD n=1 Tax=Candidatus Nitrohelix vancouverensis TaxID=2705534 RepID=A0A7T0C076_9BACT|nr:MAG: biopolymer transporter ExbD [Candidatus Nitrohelix vancouverensis]